jgi:hypothetical protein
MHIFVPCPQFFCLFKLIAHVCTLKMAADELSAYCSSSHSIPELCNKFSFSAFTMPLYLAFKGGWLDLVYGISGVWALGPQCQFQKLLDLSVLVCSGDHPTFLSANILINLRDPSRNLIGIFIREKWILCHHHKSII